MTIPPKCSRLRCDLNAIQLCAGKNYISQQCYACASTRTVSASSRCTSKALNFTVISSAQWDVHVSEVLWSILHAWRIFRYVKTLRLRVTMEAYLRRCHDVLEVRLSARGLLVSPILRTYNVVTSWVQTLFMLRPSYKDYCLL